MMNTLASAMEKQLAAVQSSLDVATAKHLQKLEGSRTLKTSAEGKMDKSPQPLPVAAIESAAALESPGEAFSEAAAAPALEVSARLLALDSVRFGRSTSVLKSPST